MIKNEVLESFTKKNALVTGGTGLIGRQIVNFLCNAGANVRSVSLDKVKVHPRADHVLGDLTDFKFCQSVTKDMDYVFHVAGIKGSIEVTKSKPASFFVPLLMFNTNVLEACRINKVQKVVYTSSIGAYSSAEIFRESSDIEGPPMDMFPGWAKRMAEMQIQAYKIQYGFDHFAIVRPCNVYGPGDNFDPNNAMVIPSLMHRINQKEDPVMIWGDGCPRCVRRTHKNIIHAFDRLSAVFHDCQVGLYIVYLFILNGGRTLIEGGPDVASFAQQA